MSLVARASGPVTLVVGFDLDMTLVDSRPGIAHALHTLASETGRPIAVDAMVARLGPPVKQTIAPWFSPDELPAAVARFRELMMADGIRMCAPLPGAAAALEASLGTRDGVRWLRISNGGNSWTLLTVHCDGSGHSFTLQRARMGGPAITSAGIA